MKESWRQHCYWGEPKWAISYQGQPYDGAFGMIGALTRIPGITAAHIDFWLWETSQKKSPGDLPYHRTLTTAY